MAHGDYCDYRNFVLKRLDLSNDIGALCDFIKGIEGTFGGDREECYELVLQEAQSLQWSATSAKALVVIGDSSPHAATEYRKITWQEELEKLKLMGVRIYGVRCGESKDSFYDEISEETGGNTLEISRFGDIVELVMGLCYLEAAERVGRERRIRDTVNEQSSSKGEEGSSSANLMDVDVEKEGNQMERYFEFPENHVEGDENEEGGGIDAGDAMKIHFAIHSSQKEVQVRGQSFEISIGRAGCKFVKVGKQTFIEQNKDRRGSEYAKMAIEGRKITWIIKNGKWGLIIGENHSEINPNIAESLN